MIFLHDRFDIFLLIYSLLLLLISFFSTPPENPFGQAIFLPRQIFPIITDFDAVFLVGKQSNNIQHTKPPFGILLVSNGTHFAVVKKVYGNFCIVHIFLKLILPLCNKQTKVIINFVLFRRLMCRIIMTANKPDY